MILKASDIQAGEYKVYFNGRFAPYCISACESTKEQEGYIEILDYSQFIGMAPGLEDSNTPDDGEPEPIEFKTIKKFGNVIIKREFPGRKNK